ncbi:MAG TPA: hypothetical protein VJ755_12425 [Gemmatimonadales bacterium]|nr:hypothetical protein [Gemmatimonadales bacterium]
MPSFKPLALVLLLLPVGLAAQESAPADTSGFRAGQWGVQFAAGYWVTPNLSMGGTGVMMAGYSRRVDDNSTTRNEQSGWFVSGVNVLLVVGLYF